MGGPWRRGPAPRCVCECLCGRDAAPAAGREAGPSGEGGERIAGAARLLRALALPAARQGAGRAQAAAGGMESLLENPVRAVLYLKELTAIVQNQQSLIHTQRQRIDELERRLDELSAENRSLWEHQQLLQAQPPPGLVPPSPAPLPATPATAAAAAAQPSWPHRLLSPSPRPSRVIDSSRQQHACAGRRGLSACIICNRALRRSSQLGKN